MFDWIEMHFFLYENAQSNSSLHCYTKWKKGITIILMKIKACENEPSKYEMNETKKDKIKLKNEKNSAHCTHVFTLFACPMYIFNEINSWVEFSIGK